MFPITGSYRVEGPAEPVPATVEDPAPPVEELRPRPRWYQAGPAKDPGRWLRRGQIGSVVFVAAVAFVQSWSHIYDIAHTHGQNHIDAALLPLSVDGMIISCSLTIARAAKEGRDVSPITRAMLWLAVGATVAANVVYGLPFGWVGIASSAWPAVAFLGTVEGVFGGLLSRRRRAEDADTEPGQAADSATDSGADTETDSGADTGGDTTNGNGAGERPKRRRRNAGAKLQPKERHARRLLDKNGALTGKELAAKIDVDERTGQRYRSRWLAAKAGETRPGADADTTTDSKELAGVGS